MPAGRISQSFVVGDELKWQLLAGYCAPQSEAQNSRWLPRLMQPREFGLGLFEERDVGVGGEAPVSVAAKCLNGVDASGTGCRYERRQDCCRQDDSR